MTTTKKDQKFRNELLSVCTRVVLARQRDREGRRKPWSDEQLMQVILFTATVLYIELPNPVPSQMVDVGVRVSAAAPASGPRLCEDVITTLLTRHPMLKSINGLTLRCTITNHQSASTLLPVVGETLADALAIGATVFLDILVATVAHTMSEPDAQQGCRDVTLNKAYTTWLGHSPTPQLTNAVYGSLLTAMNSPDCVIDLTSNLKP